MKHFAFVWMAFIGALSGYETLPLTTFVKDASIESYNDVRTNPYIESKERQALENYVLPSKHSIKPILDSIFTASRATANRDTLKAAGFQILKDQPRSFIIVAKHPSVPGYLFKLHLDNDKRKKRGHPGWYWFSKRIEAINQIQKCIQDKKIRLFKTPKKWVYPLPVIPSPPSGSEYERKNFVLVVEDMNILNNADNVHAWKHDITYKHLDELRTILKACGGSSIRPRNLPFSIDGKIAFIDTEYPNTPPQYHELTHHLSDKMAVYWKKITRK